MDDKIGDYQSDRSEKKKAAKSRKWDVRVLGPGQLERNTDHPLAGLTVEEQKAARVAAVGRLIARLQAAGTSARIGADHEETGPSS